MVDVTSTTTIIGEQNSKKFFINEKNSIEDKILLSIYFLFFPVL